MNNALLDQAKEVALRAYAPYSNYHVGAALIDERGKTFVGTNVENISYGGTICAERSAICTMIADGGRKVTELAVYTRNLGTPCGMCLQVLSEFCAPDTPVYLLDSEGQTRSLIFRDLFPQPFKGLD